jgi:hypothetical protein
LELLLPTHSIPLLLHVSTASTSTTSKSPQQPRRRNSSSSKNKKTRHRNEQKTSSTSSESAQVIFLAAPTAELDQESTHSADLNYSQYLFGIQDYVCGANVWEQVQVSTNIDNETQNPCATTSISCVGRRSNNKNNNNNNNNLQGHKLATSSLYQKAMSTAAMPTDKNTSDSGSNLDTNASASAATSNTTENTKQLFGKLSWSAHNVLGNTGRALGNFLPTQAAIAAMTQQKYTLPDKTVASQVLMYRQLLHTNCRPGLRLSRPYQGTPAQQAVLHMPWWEQGIEQSQKMVISYDNLIVRLWMNGGIMPFADLLGGDVDTMIDEKGLPPIPHAYWVERLGFQQPDPVTDFRSGGVLSLAMMVHM